MDFRTYAEYKRKEAHREILTDICMIINSCAECYNDETRDIDCYPLHRVKIHKASADSFYIESYDNSKINRKLIDIASEHGYTTGLIMEDDVVFIKFWK